jgi:hydrogenase expression/formation protein HypE
MNVHNTERIIRAVLFDFDGTLTVGTALDFTAIRREIGCPEGVSLLEYIEALEVPEQRHAAAEKLAFHERQGASRSYPAGGALDLLRFLRIRNIPYGILTRNSRESVSTSMANFPKGCLDTFRTVICRDDEYEVKPSSAGVLRAAEVFDVAPDEIVVIGDYLYDVQAGNNAGALTVFLDAGENSSISRKSEAYKLAVEEADYTVNNLDQFREYIDMFLPLLPGKLPNRLLEQIFAEIEIEDPSVIVAPGVGEDTAAVRLSGGPDVLVLKSDPVTFVGEGLGRYAVIVNANDVATAGAVPRWYLMDLLLPPGTTGNTVRKIILETAEAVTEAGITLCGGHTEVTGAVTRAVLSGALIGTVPESGLIRKRNMREGDMLLMTKTAGCEGTGIIASEFAGLLREKGIAESDVESGREFTEKISILSEAKIGVGTGHVTAMHDVTEGGIAAAIEELSAAGGNVLHVDIDAIAVSPVTARICKALDLDPFGLIGSGCLLLTCSPAGVEVFESELEAAGIESARIGRVGKEGTGIDASSGGTPAEWPRFETDELTKLY